MSDIYPGLSQLHLKVLGYNYIENLPRWQFEDHSMSCWRFY